jgi:CTP-dependent riboflavin kinase
MQNTENKLNVYERWGEWCTQTLDNLFGDIKDTFEDHHYLEFYGTQPSGGAGDYYYSRYNPANILHIH